MSPPQQRGTFEGAEFRNLVLCLVFVCAADAAVPQPVITSVENGAGFQSNFAQASWVLIKGSNLATNTRTWRADEIKNGQLPTSLDGTSVSIDGKPAFVYYISPTQLSVQAPGDPAAGNVPVVVTNNGVSSDAVNGSLEPFSPAIFLWPGNYVAASHLDFSLAVKNGEFPPLATVPAKPGEVIILWGTGFGATNPAVPAGQIVPAVPQHTLISVPTITIGGVTAEYVGGALAPGSAGLYQIAVRVPATLADGDAAVAASVGGFSSPSGALLTIHNPGAVAPLAISTASPLPAGTVGVRYSVPLAATGGVPPYMWSISAGSLPSGFALDRSSGNITGTPPAAGSAAFTAQAEDSSGIKAMASFSLTVQATIAPKRTVVMLHGIRQQASDLAPFEASLQAALDASLVTVNAAFDYGDCTTNTQCPASCTISAGAQRLAAFLKSSVPPGHILIVGYSLGGLIARDLLLNNYDYVLSSYGVDALVTLGTPNLGYPYETIDDSESCPVLDQEMQGNYRDPRGFVWSTYLNTFNHSWISGALPAGPVPWLAIAGTACGNPWRLGGVDIFHLQEDVNTGCRNGNPLNDNVVCEDSALFDVASIGLSGDNLPSQTLFLSQYSHTTGNAIENLVIDSLFYQCSWVSTESLADPGQDLIPSIANFLKLH